MSLSRTGGDLNHVSGEVIDPTRGVFVHSAYAGSMAARMLITEAMIPKIPEGAEEAHGEREASKQELSSERGEDRI